MDWEIGRDPSLTELNQTSETLNKVEREKAAVMENLSKLRGYHDSQQDQLASTKASLEETMKLKDALSNMCFTNRYNIKTARATCYYGEEIGVYISQNWPVLHVAASEDGMYLAVAGLHGLILYDIRLNSWRFFGDVTQEQKIHCTGLLWMGKIIFVCNYIESSNMSELLFYPRYHLDWSSLLYQKPLLAKPMVMDVYNDYLLVTYHPFDVYIYHVKVSGDLTPSSTPDIQISSTGALEQKREKKGYLDKLREHTKKLESEY